MSISFAEGGSTHGKRTPGRFPLEHYRTLVAGPQSPAFQIPWKKTLRQQKSTDRHPLCAEDGHTMGRPSQGDGLRLGDELLATTPRLARGRGMAEAPRSAAFKAAGSRQNRLVTSHSGQFLGTCSFWGHQTGPNPTDRRKLGSKHHLITEAGGIPLAVILTGANAHDVTQLMPLVEAIPPIRGKRGRPRQKPAMVQGDRGYDSQSHREELLDRGIQPVLAKRGTEHGSGLGVYRWVVERTLSWLHQYRRLRVRYEKRADIHEAFLSLGCSLICWKSLKGSFC